MSFVQERLPLEYAPREALRIYGNRLLAFAGVVGANVLFLILIQISLSEPIAFCFAAIIVGGFVFVCWWASRDAVLMKAHETFAKTPIDFKSDAEALGAILTLIMGSYAAATPRNKRIEVRMIRPQTLRDLLEDAKRFQSNVVALYFRARGDLSLSKQEADQWHRLASISADVDNRIVTAMENIPEEDLGKDIDFLKFNEVETNKVHSWVLTARFVRDLRNGFDMGTIIHWYITSGPVVLDILGKEHLTNPTMEEIKIIKFLFEELHKELQKIIHA